MPKAQIKNRYKSLGDYSIEVAEKIKAFDQALNVIADKARRVETIAQLSYENIENKAISDYCFKRLKHERRKSEEPTKSKIKGLLLAVKATYYWQESDYDRCINHFHKAISILKVIGDCETEAYLNQMTAFSYLAKGDIEVSFKAAYHSLQILNEEPKSTSRGWTFYTLGVLYSESKDYIKALQYYKKAQKAFNQNKHTKYGHGRALNGLGNVYIALNKKNLAEKTIIKSIEIFKEIDHKVGLSRAINDLGVLLIEQGEFKNAEKQLLESLALRNHIGHLQGSITTLYQLGVLKNKQKNFIGAEKYLKQALKLVKKTNTKNKEVLIERALFNALKKLGKLDEAIESLEQYVLLKEQISGEETARKLQHMETRMAAERAEKEAEIERLRNVELKLAHDIITEKNKEILDSINYAKRIQGAILPSLRIVKEYLKDSFILYKPKDVVAGDFYWLHQNNGKTLFAAADCTGHGVPGAMVSVICNNALNRSTREYGLTDPGEILNKTREIVIQEFEKSDDEVKDGMDIALCSLEGMTLQYAGAHNPLWIIRKGEMIEYKADKQPIGKYVQIKPYTTHVIDLKKGDCLYIFSDGYVDQFGGETGKKFMSKKLKELLLSIQDKSMETQRIALDDAFMAWCGKEPQIDDVCVIGVKV